MTIPMAPATEAEMAKFETPWLKTIEELTEFIENLVRRQHDYGTCVYAMSLAAHAAYNYVAGTLGVTGFQASCADLDFIKRSRHYKHGFIIFDANALLYPQYDLDARFSKWKGERLKRLAGPARELLASKTSAHPDVVEHWEKLAAQETTDGTEQEED